MNMKKAVPENVQGVQTNTEEKINFDNISEAESFFAVVRQRLFSVKEWHSYAGSLSAFFTLTDEDGNEVNKHLEKGDLIKIKIAAPASESGEGYDWVRIEEILDEKSHEMQLAGFRVRPSPSPVNEMKDVAHFFSDEATSSFIIKREHNMITAGVYGRNEKPNTNTETLIDKIRNAAVAVGAITGFSKLQWKSLVSGFLKKD